MKLYKVSRKVVCKGEYSDIWVLACDPMWAEKIARQSNFDFRKEKKDNIYIEKIDLSKEQIVCEKWIGWE